MTAPRSDPPPDVNRALFALLTVQLLFGLLPVAGKVAMPVFGAGGVACWRVVGGAAVFSALCWARGLVPLPWRDQGRALVCAMLGIASNQLLYLYGLSRTTAVNATMIVTMVPVITYVVAMLAGVEALSGRRALGILLGLCGVAVLVSGDLHGAALVGDLMVLGNTVSYAIYLVLARPLLARYAPLQVIAAVFLWAVPVTVGVVGLVDGLPDPSLILSAPGASVVDPALEAARAASDPRLALLFVVLGPTIGTYWLNLYALQRVPPSTVALFIYLQPVISALSAGRVLGEAPGGRTWVAGLLSGAGVWLASRPARAAPVPARPTQPGGGTG